MPLDDPFGFDPFTDPSGFSNDNSQVEVLFEYVQEILRWASGIFNWMFGVLSNVIQYLNAEAGGVGNLLKHIWQNFVKVLLLHIVSVIHSIVDWLERHLRPIINYLKRLRAFYDAWFRTYIRPILVMIQHVRQFLQLLRLLHINIAVKLDSILAQVEGRIAQTFLTIRAALNNAIDLLNVLADPTNLLRKPTLLLSIRRTLPALIRTVTGRPPGYWFPSPRGASSKQFAPVPGNFVATDPAMNPPASSYLGTDDGIGGVGVFSLANVPPDSAVDDADSLDYFDDALYPASPCADPITCLIQAAHVYVKG